MKLREFAHKYIDNLLEVGQFDPTETMCMLCPLSNGCVHCKANTCEEVCKKFIEDYDGDEE